MSMKRLVAVLFVLVFLALPRCGASGEAEDAAVVAAQKWLNLIDTSEYGESWEQAATYFKQVVPKEKWEQAVGAVRGPLGELKARKVKSATYATSLPGAPDGEYVVIQFSASFSKKQSAVETVTPMKEPDGTWRVSGYYIK